MGRPVYLPERFPIRIDPINDESLSSWITRVATFYYLQPHELPWSGNAYKGISESCLKSLSCLTGVCPNAIQALTLQRRYAALDERWVRNLSDELAHCDICLSEMYDKHGFAYLRADWELRCVTTCHIHHIPLISVCRDCLESVSLRYVETRNRWEVICPSCSQNNIQPQLPKSVGQHVALHFVVELEQVLIDSLRANQSYLHFFQGGDAKSLMDAILDMLELNKERRNILAYANPPITPAWTYRFFTQLEYDRSCLWDVLQMTADRETLQYICGEMSNQMFARDGFYYAIRSRLIRVQEDDICTLIERRKRWPSTLQRLAERTWIAIAESRVYQGRDKPGRGTKHKAPGPKPIYEEISFQSERTIHWQRPSSAELQPFATVIEQIKLELAAQGRLARHDDIQKLAFRRMRERSKSSN